MITGKMNRVTAVMMAMVLSSGGLLTACGQSSDKNSNQIVVFNYGDYIDVELLEQFEVG